MNTIAKWIALGWSAFCLVGVIYGLANVAVMQSPQASDVAKAGTAIGVGLGLIYWIVIWIVIAGPALFIFLLTNKPK